MGKKKVEGVEGEVKAKPVAPAVEPVATPTTVEAAKPAVRERSDNALTPDEAAKMVSEGKLNIVGFRKEEFLHRMPVTPRAIETLEGVKKEVAAKRGGRLPEEYGRGERLWQMLQARARNAGKQLQSAEVEQVHKDMLALIEKEHAKSKARWESLFEPKADDTAPRSDSDTDCDGVIGCGKKFKPQTRNVVRDGVVLTFRDGKPIRSGNFHHILVDENGKPDPDHGTKRLVALCDYCTKRVGGPSYSYERAVELLNKETIMASARDAKFRDRDRRFGGRRRETPYSDAIEERRREREHRR